MVILSMTSRYVQNLVLQHLVNLNCLPLIYRRNFEVISRWQVLLLNGRISKDLFVTREPYKWKAVDLTEVCTRRKTNEELY